MSRHDISQQLDRHNILPTPQRLQIAELLLDKPQHLSVEQIVYQLRQTGSGIAKATVYNTLNLFAERGLIKELVIDRERRYFDSATHHHHHFYNVDTGELTDIEDGHLEFRQVPALPEGTKADSVEVVIKIRNA